MQLSKFSDYSLRVLMFVGLRGDALSTVSQIADAFDVSRHHLVKVTSRLVELGLLQATRGRGGGLGLAIVPAEIGIGDVVRQTENLELVECMRDDGGCVLTGSCKLQRALGRARDAFLASLDEVTLADLLRPAAPLRELLLER